MNILDLLHSRGLHPVHVSAAKGGEYASPCPGCGGKDRFHTFPEQEGGPICQDAGVRGTYWCRKCGAGGDVFQYLLDFADMSFADACAELGAKMPRKLQLHGRLPQPPKPSQAPAFTPREMSQPSATWRERAAKLVDKAHERLLRAPTPLAWLAARGLDLDAVRKYRLGYLEGEGDKLGIIRPRKVWGLEPEERKNADGTKSVRTTFFIPRGIVIPAYGPEGPFTATGEAAAPIRVRIRRSDADAKVFGDKYMVVKGSGMAPMLLGASRRAHVVVEAELDAMLVHHLAGDKAGALAVLTNLGKPDVTAHAALARSLCVLVALDYDKAGASGWTWWQANCSSAKRWPVPAGKDPGDAYALGEDLRAWTLAGLPPVLTREQRPQAAPAPASTAAPAVSEPLGPSLAGEVAPQGEGEKPAQYVQAAPALAPTLTRELSQRLARLAALMRRHAVEYSGGAWRTPGHLTPAQDETLWADLLPLLTPEVDQWLKAHPVSLVTSENLFPPR